MQGLTSRELSVLLEAEPTYRVFAVAVTIEGKRCWQLEVESADEKKRYLLMAARGGVRYWKGLNFFASFVNEQYSGVTRFTVIF
jgi:hypothetical protein